MTKQDAIDWANHFPSNEKLWFGVIAFNNKFVVYDSTHFKRNPILVKQIIYKSNAENRD